MKKPIIGAILGTVMSVMLFSGLRVYHSASNYVRKLIAINNVQTPTLIQQIELERKEHQEETGGGNDGSQEGDKKPPSNDDFDKDEIYSKAPKWDGVGTDSDIINIGGAIFYKVPPYAYNDSAFYTNSVKADEMYWTLIKKLNLPTTKSQGYAVSVRPFCYEFGSKTSNAVVDGVHVMKCAVAPAVCLRDIYEKDLYRQNYNVPSKDTWPKKVMAVCESNGTTLYLPLSFADAKAHWYPFGFQQTQIANKGGILYGANPTDFSGPSGAPDLGANFSAAYNWSSTHTWKNQGTPVTADCYGAVIEPYGGSDVNCSTLCKQVKVKGFITITGSGSSGGSSGGGSGSSGGRPSWVIGLHGVDQAGANAAYDYLKAKGMSDADIQANWDALMNHYAGHGTDGW